MFKFMKPVVGVATVAAIAASLLVGPGRAVANSPASPPSAHVSLVVDHAAAKRLPAVLNCDNVRLVRPRGYLVLACGDANAMIGKAAWSSWTAKQASAVATFYDNACTPSCAADSMKAYRNASVRLYDVVSTKHGPVFAKARITYRSHGKRHVQTFDLND